LVGERDEHTDTVSIGDYATGASDISSERITAALLSMLRPSLSA
jgi:hypothetical protein